MKKTDDPQVSVYIAVYISLKINFHKNFQKTYNFTNVQFLFAFKAYKCRRLLSGINSFAKM